MSNGREITFLAKKVSTEAGYYQDRNRNNLTQVVVTLPDNHLESGILAEFSIAEILDMHHMDEFLRHFGADYVRNWLEENE